MSALNLHQFARSTPSKQICLSSFSSYELFLSLPLTTYLIVLNLQTPNVNSSGRTATPTSKFAFYIFIQQIQVLNILNMVYTLRFFSSKCSLFHNSNIFGSSIIHILFSGCAKIKKNNSGPKKVNFFPSCNDEPSRPGMV